MSDKPEKKLFLLDAFALIYRAYFAFSRNPLINSKGVNTSASTGFTNTLWDLITKEAPTHLAVVFDAPGPTDRAKEFEFYKANRQEMPEDLRASIPHIKEIVAAMNIPMLELEGYEADDLVGTIAKKAEKDGATVYMVTSDKDFGQLVSENIYLYKPPFLGRPRAILGPDEIKERWDIEDVMQLIDILGLMGDASDNIPGIRGVGEKTAIKLLKQFGSIENLLENTEQLKGKLKEKVENGKEDALISKKLATIVVDAPIEYDFDSYLIEAPDRKRLENIFNELEFRTISKRILGHDFTKPIKEQKGKPAAGTQLDLFGGTAGLQAPKKEESQDLDDVSSTDHNYELIDSPAKRKKLLKLLLKEKVVAFDTETTGIDANEAELVGISFSHKVSEAFYVPIPPDQKEAQKIVDEFRPFFESKKITKVGQNIKYDMLMIKWYGVDVQGQIEDTMLAHYLLEPDMRHNMDLLSETYLGYRPVPISTLIGPKGKKQKTMRDIPIETVCEYAAEDADITLQLYQKFDPSIKKNELDKLYYDVELPLVPVLTQMEYNGVALDIPFLQSYSEELDGTITGIKKKVFEISEVEFNLDSPRQLGEVLFGKMGIPYKGRKTKTGQYSTNEATLTGLAGKHDIVDEILHYRELNKLKSTYVDALPKLINPKTNRIHSSFNQTVAATGRLSSNNPNLQNIPIRKESGRKVRRAFIPRDKDHILLAADYSQIELRIIAALSGDSNMIEAFKEGHDIHTATAARVYNMPMEDVDSDMRRHAKMVNFGIIYGISAFGLGQRLGIRRTEAGVLIEEYFKQYPDIKAFMDKSIETAKDKGYVTTILGRKRFLRDIHSGNATVRGFAERTAINTPIQGSAADMIKVAMIKVHDAMTKAKMQSKLILQVHDELVFDARKEELEELKDLVRENMTRAVEIDVPIEVSMGIGDDWLEAH